MTLLGICESILTKMSSFQTAIKEYLVFLLGLLEQSSKITLAPGIKSSLHLPVFLTWTFSSLSFIRTWAINLLGLLTKIPSTTLLYFIETPLLIIISINCITLNFNKQEDAI